MNLKEKIQEEIKTSLKSGDQVRRSVLGMLMAAIKNRELIKRATLSKTIGDAQELEAKSQLSDDETLETISSESKKRQESIVQFKAGNRPDLVEREEKELVILKSYLPEQVGDGEIQNTVLQIIGQTGATGPKDLGRVMGGVLKILKGKADGGRVSEIVKEELARMA